MAPSAKDFERAISCLREYRNAHSGAKSWIFSPWTDDPTYRYEQCPPNEFLVRLRHTVYRAASYQRWVSVAHLVMQIMSLFRLEGD